MTVLTGKDPDRTYQGILNIGNALNSSAQQITDGLGNEVGMTVSTSEIEIINDLIVHDITIMGGGFPYQGFVSIKDYGAIGDGVTNDTAAFAAAFATARDIYIPEGTYIIASTITVASNLHVLGHKNSILKFTANTTGLSLGNASNVYLEGFTLEGPTSTEVYVSNSKGITIGGTYATRGSNNYFIDLTMYNWGMAAFWFEYAYKTYVSRCNLYRISKYGVVCLSGDGLFITNNHIGNIKPGASGAAGALNAYGIMLTRNVNNVTLTTDPATTNVVVTGNRVYDVPSWEGIDTHGGVNIVIADNIISGCAKGINATHANGTGTSTDVDSAEHIIIKGNTMVAGAGSLGDVRVGITLTPWDSSHGGPYPSGFVISDNYIEGYGTTGAADSHGAIFAANFKGLTCTGNVLKASNFIGIHFNGECDGAIVNGNYIEDVASVSGFQEAIYVLTSTFSGIIANNMFTNPAGTTYNAIGISATQGAGYGVIVGQNYYDDSITAAFISSTHENRVASFEFKGTAGFKVHSGTTAQRAASPVDGYVRYNTTIGGLEGYRNSGWVPVCVGNSATLAVDTAMSVPLPSAYGVIEIFAESSSYPTLAAVISYKYTAAAYTQIIAQPAALVTATTGVLAGTTGGGGTFNVSVHTDGNLYFENRLAASRTFGWTIRGSA